MITLQNKYQYAKSDIIGQGTYGDVYLAKNLTNNQQCVLKIERESEFMTLERLQNEAKQIEHLRHPNIVRGYDHFIFENEFYIVMQYYENQDLATYLAKSPAPSQQQILKWIVQLASALNYLHSQQVIHRDVKIQNIFIDAELNAYLGDFGTARELSRRFASTFIGTPQTMAPEVVAEQPYCCKTDMWSIGCIVYELIEGHPAFQAKNFMAVIKLISEAAYSPPKKADEFVKEIINNLLVVDPVKRWDSYQLCRYLEEELRAYNLPSPIVVENVIFTRQLNDAERTLIVQFNNIQNAASQTTALQNNIFMSQNGTNDSGICRSFSQQSQLKTFSEIIKQKMYIKLLNLLNDEDNLYELIVAQMLLYGGESQEAVSIFLNVQEQFLATKETNIIVFMLQMLLSDTSKVIESQILVDLIAKITYQEDNVAEQTTQISMTDHPQIM